MSFKNGKYFNLIIIKSVDYAISTVNKLSDVRIAYFWHCPSTSRIIRQNCFSMVNESINKPNSALQTVTRNELLYIN